MFLCSLADLKKIISKNSRVDPTPGRTCHSWDCSGLKPRLSGFSAWRSLNLNSCLGKTKTLPALEERDLIAYTLYVITVRYWKDSKIVRFERGINHMHMHCLAKVTILALVGISLGLEVIVRSAEAGKLNSALQVTGVGYSKGSCFPLERSLSSGAIVIYPMNSVIQHSNKWGQVSIRKDRKGTRKGGVT